MASYQMDTTSMFGSMPGSGGGANFLSDYASIKNGSYGKVLGAYYDKQKQETSTSNDQLKLKYNDNAYKTSPLGPTDSSDTLNKLGSAVKALGKSGSNLSGGADGKGSVFDKKEITAVDDAGEEYTYEQYDQEGIYKAVKSFVDDYNKMLDAGKGSVSTNIIGRINDLNQMTQGSKEMLAKAGVSVGADGRLTLDEKALKNADIEDVKKTFNGIGSFADKVESKSFMIDLAVTREARNSDIAIEYSKNSNVSETDKSSSVSTSKDTTKQLSEIEEDAENLKKSADEMLKYGAGSVFTKEFFTVTDADGVTSNKMDYNKDKIYDSVYSFVRDYNELLESGAKSNASSIINKLDDLQYLTKNNKRELEDIGITIGKDGKLSIDKEKFMRADMVDVKNIFNGTGSYGYKVSSQADKIDSAAVSESTKSNTYGNNGTYNNNHTAGDIFTAGL